MWCDGFWKDSIACLYTPPISSVDVTTSTSAPVPSVTEDSGESEDGNSGAMGLFSSDAYFVCFVCVLCIFLNNWFCSS